LFFISTIENRKRFISVFFLGIGRICRNEKAGAPIETPAHSCRFAQSYSSWSCSPAELHYASDCGTKVHTRFVLAIKITEKIILQFELLNTYYSKKSCKLSYTPKIFVEYCRYVYFTFDCAVGLFFLFCCPLSRRCALERYVRDIICFLA